MNTTSPILVSIACAPRSAAFREVPTYLACYEALTKYFVPYPQEQLDEGRDHHARLVAAFRDHDPIAAVDIARIHVDALRREMFVGLGRKP